MRGNNAACSLGALHYIVVTIIFLDSIIFMFGFPPFFITKLAPAVYYFILIYYIAAGSVLFCLPKLVSIWNKNAIETIIFRRQQLTRKRKRSVPHTPKSLLTTKELQLVT